MPRFFGTPPNVNIGQFFIDRRELHGYGVHRPLQAGISGTKDEGSDSICLSGGYVDDEDHGDYIIYTGHGGNDANTGRQVAHQNIDSSGNAGLITSRVKGLPVRVIRGASHKSPYSPPKGYQYAGLFTVSEYWIEEGLNGFDVVRFRLDRMPEQAQLVTSSAPEPDVAFATTTVTRRVRDSALSRAVKTIYDDACQVCGTAITSSSGRSYSEGAHVKPLGRPHLGPDTLDNILCLCPNHHVQLDIGGMVILDNFDVAVDSLSGPFGSLSFKENHHIDRAFASFHRNLWSSI